jgi:hypothetical protein
MMNRIHDEADRDTKPSQISGNRSQEARQAPGATNAKQENKADKSSIQQENIRQPKNRDE